MGSKLAIAMLAASVLVPARALPLAAQARPPRVLVVPPLLAIALNDLTFGSVLPGIPSAVSPLDVHRAGQFEVTGPAGASVRVEFVLPSALTADGGARLPISFGAGDGLADFSREHLPHGIVFDPHAPVIGTLSADGRLFLRLGATALPGRPQAGGTYRATISLTVYDLGS
jgi:hypothetical protein